MAGIYEDNVSTEVWLMLLDADIGDRLDIEISGQKGTYYIGYESLHEGDDLGRLTLSSGSGRSSNFTDAFTDSGLQSIERYVWDTILFRGGDGDGLIQLISLA